MSIGDKFIEHKLKREDQIRRANTILQSKDDDNLHGGDLEVKDLNERFGSNPQFSNKRFSNPQFSNNNLDSKDLTLLRQKLEKYKNELSEKRKKKFKH